MYLARRWLGETRPLTFELAGVRGHAAFYLTVKTTRVDWVVPLVALRVARV